MASQLRRISSSPTSLKPERVMVFTDGRIPRIRSGPPVPRSSSASVDERLDGHEHRLFPRQVALEALLERVPRVLAPRALGEVVRLLVAATRDVVLEEPPRPRALVEAGEDGDDHEPLHRHRQVHPDHLAELVGLAVQRQVLALDLLVVLELGLEEAGHLHGRARGARDADAGEVVGLEDLLDAPRRDLVALARLAVTRHHDAVAVAKREDGGAVRGRRRLALSARLGAAGQELR